MIMGNPSLWEEYIVALAADGVPLFNLSWLHQWLHMLELGSHASLRDATDEINILLVGMLHDGDTSI